MYPYIIHYNTLYIYNGWIIKNQWFKQYMTLYVYSGFAVPRSVGSVEA